MSRLAGFKLNFAPRNYRHWVPLYDAWPTFSWEAEGGLQWLSEFDVKS